MLSTDLRLCSSSIVIQLLTKLNTETVHFKRNVSSTEKCKTKKGKEIKSRIKKKEKEITKLQKKVAQEGDVKIAARLEVTTRELYSSYKDLEDLEQKSCEDLRETEERYLTLTLSSLQSVFKEEVKLYIERKNLKEFST